MEQICRPLLRREPFQHQQESRRKRRRQLQRIVIGGHAVHRLGQPGADIVHPRPVRGLQHVDATPRADRREPSIRIVDRIAVRPLPFDESVLHGILGVGARAEDAVGQPQKPGAGLFEDGRIAARRHSVPRHSEAVPEVDHGHLAGEKTDVAFGEVIAQLRPQRA